MLKDNRGSEHLEVVFRDSCNSYVICFLRKGHTLFNLDSCVSESGADTNKTTASLLEVMIEGLFHK